MEKNRTIHAAFTDLKWTFDRVPKIELCKSLKESRISKSLYNPIRSLYMNCRNYVQKGNTRPAEFNMRQGVRQGCNLSPLLFIIYLDDIMKKCHERVKKLTINRPNYLMRPVTLTDLVFAGELIVVASNEKNLKC